MTSVPALFSRDGVADQDERREIARVVARESAETIAAPRTGAAVELLARLLTPAADRVSRRFLSYDQALGLLGPLAGANWILEREIGSLEVRDGDRVPQQGPLLVVANHPGISDAVALLAAMRRDDTWIVTAEFPFLRALRHARQRFLFVPDDRDGGRAALWQVVSRLRAGEAVLLFPAGGIELDPELAPVDASRSIAIWSRSVGLLARRAPGTRVLPAAVSGAVSRGAFDHPLARRRASLRERQRMAALLQLALARYQRVRVRVRFGEPIESGDAVDVQGAVRERMRTLLAAV
ncbi:MAG: hypothetical protein AUH85_08675 [Chloroflexi bacterium 13_1_40CM_4_68_4]|nr:MAG: hypothetical protein AUH85_08675 [Chloroflexi bacterium 13_1_40CM_4_68_4]